MTIATYTNTAFAPDQLIGRNAELLLDESVTLISGQNLKRGALLGKITTGGKFTLSLSASGDGSQTPYRVLALDCDASAGDKTALVYKRGDFIEDGITFGASHTVASTAVALNDLGIFIIPNVGGV